MSSLLALRILILGITALDPKALIHLVDGEGL